MHAWNIMACAYVICTQEIDMSLITENYWMLQEILMLLERILLFIANGYRGWNGWEIRGEPVEGSGRDIEPSRETDE